MFPGFPVEIGGVAELHAAFREESRTRGCVPEPRNRKSGFATAYMGRKRSVRMLLLSSRTLLSGTGSYAQNKRRSKGLRPISVNLYFGCFSSILPQNRHPRAERTTNLSRETALEGRAVEGPRRCSFCPCCSELFNHRGPLLASRREQALASTLQCPAFTQTLKLQQRSKINRKQPSAFVSTQRLQQGLLPPRDIHLPDDRMLASPLQHIAPGSAVSCVVDDAQLIHHAHPSRDSVVHLYIHGVV